MPPVSCRSYDDALECFEEALALLDRAEKTPVPGAPAPAAGAAAGKKSGAGAGAGALLLGATKPEKQRFLDLSLRRATAVNVAR